MTTCIRKNVNSLPNASVDFTENSQGVCLGRCIKKITKIDNWKKGVLCASIGCVFRATAYVAFPVLDPIGLTFNILGKCLLLGGIIAMAHNIATGHIKKPQTSQTQM